MTGNRLRRLLVLAFVATAFAQDRPSNGLLEMSIASGKQNGMLAITLKNVNLGQTVSLLEWDAEAQYECEVLDAAGKPVPLTAEGEKLRDSRHDRLLYRSRIQIMRLESGEQFTTQLDLARLFQIKPKETYTVKVRRSAGLPDRNQSGKKIEQELSRSWVMAAREDH